MKEVDTTLVEKFFRVGVMIHRYHHFQQREHGPIANPHRGQGRVLSLLKMQPEISQKELSYLLDMRSQSLGELLMKLERNGFITRTPSESDRRIMNIKLTKQGADATADPDERPDFEELFGFLSQEDQAKLSDLLDKLIEGLEGRVSEEEEMLHDMGHHRGHHPHFGHRERGFGHGGFHRGCHGHDHKHGPDRAERGEERPHGGHCACDEERGPKGGERRGR